MKRGHDTRLRAADGIAPASPVSVRAAGAGLILATLVLAACAGPRTPAPISHRSITPARAPVAVVPPASPAPAGGQPVAPEQAGQAAQAGQSQAPVVESEPVMAGRVEARPLGGSVALPAPEATGEVRQGPSGLKRPYSDEAYARLAAAPMQGKRPSATVASAAGSSAAPAPAAAAASAQSDTGKFAWPVKGQLIQRFTDPASMGIAIEAAQGAPVLAAEAGKVIFSGPGPRGYGNLVIVKHPDDLLSVYAHNSRILVKEGQNVTRGQRIAEVGSTGTSSARLGFEVRRDGKPIDPMNFLAGG